MNPSLFSIKLLLLHVPLTQPALQDAASQARLYILMHECRPAVQASAYLL